MELTEEQISLINEILKAFDEGGRKEAIMLNEIALLKYLAEKHSYILIADHRKRCEICSKEDE